MEMTRRQFAVSLAAASFLRSSLFEPLSPLGVPRGVVPGRVTWAHDSAAAKWDGTGSWWTDANNDQSAIDRMVARSIRGLTNEKSDCPYRKFCAVHGGCHSPNRTAKLKQFAALPESGERNSPMHACAMEHSSDKHFKDPRSGSA